MIAFVVFFHSVPSRSRSLHYSATNWLYRDPPPTFGISNKCSCCSLGLRPFHLGVASPTSCSLTSEVISRTCWVSSLTAFAWSVAERTRYIHASVSLFFFCIMTERTKHIHAQCSFHFLAEWHKTFANGKLAKWLIGETTGHHSMTFLLWTWPVIGQLMLSGQTPNENTTLNRKTGAKMWPVCSLNESIAKSFE